VTCLGSFFVADGESGLTATEATAGPWAGHLQHGGPPSALLVRAAEQAVGREDVVALRVAVDFLSPVPVGPVQVSASVAKPGRTAVAVDAELSAGGRTVLRGRVWLVRLTDDGPHVAAAGDAGFSHPDDLPAALLRWEFPYAVHMDWRRVDGDPDGPGEAHVWARQRVPLVAGEAPSGLQRAVVAADSGSGVSAVLDWDRWSFVNVDLDVHLLRPLVGEWVALDAVTRVSPTGSALCATTLRDTAGWLGTAAQTLVVQPR
jgi:acyl-coenzyme A thioesterase PaaI-like protein